jgi:hypothetical protein
MTWEKPGKTPLVRLECDGLATGDFSVPSFRVRAGQAVCLHVLLPSPAWYEEVLPILTGRRMHPALRYFGTVAYLDRPRSRRRWWGGRHAPPAHDWLTVEKGLTAAEAAAVLGLADVSPDLSVGRVGWNERTIMALEACLLRPPDLLLFDTAGNDLSGSQRIFERLSRRPPGLAIIYLKTRLETDDPCLPGGCLTINRREQQASLAE